jgi:hypothetical protein
MWVSNSGRNERIVSSKRPDTVWGHPVLYSKVTGVFPGIKLPEHEVDYSSPSSVNLKNEWSYVSAPPRAFVECLEGSSLFSLIILVVIAVSYINCLNK